MLVPKVFVTRADALIVDLEWGFPLLPFFTADLRLVGDAGEGRREIRIIRCPGQSHITAEGQGVPRFHRLGFHLRFEVGDRHHLADLQIFHCRTGPVQEHDAVAQFLGRTGEGAERCRSSQIERGDNRVGQHPLRVARLLVRNLLRTRIDAIGHVRQCAFGAGTDGCGRPFHGERRGFVEDQLLRFDDDVGLPRGGQFDSQTPVAEFEGIPKLFVESSRVGARCEQRVHAAEDFERLLQRRKGDIDVERRQRTGCQVEVVHRVIRGEHRVDFEFGRPRQTGDIALAEQRRTRHFRHLLQSEFDAVAHFHTEPFGHGGSDYDAAGQVILGTITVPQSEDRHTFESLVSVAHGRTGEQHGGGRFGHFRRRLLPDHAAADERGADAVQLPLGPRPKTAAEGIADEERAGEHGRTDHHPEKHGDVGHPEVVQVADCEP